MTGIPSEFCTAYAEHRAAEGRGYSGESLLALPYLRHGPFEKQWRVRARSFEAFVARVIKPAARSLDVLDLGAGNGWLCHRLAGLGHKPVALDIRDDAVDGLGAAAGFGPAKFERVVASFEALPFGANVFDVAVFNASLHYARDLARVLGEAARVTRPGGTVVILDTPFYARQADGEAMVAQKRKSGAFGAKAEILLGQDFIEFLTPERLRCASALIWRRHRVLYPVWYELRPLRAFLKGERKPSRFDLWTAAVP